MGWIIDNLVDPKMNNISVVPELDIKKAGGIGKSEQILTYMVQQRMKTNKVRVRIEEVDIWTEPYVKTKKKGYHARMVRLDV